MGLSSGTRDGLTYFQLLIETPASSCKLISCKYLCLISRHGVEDVEEGVLLEFAEIPRFQSRRCLLIACWYLRQDFV